MADPHDEFKALHRKFQYLEQNRKDYVKESGVTIARQQKILSKLKKDNEYLKDQYRLLVKKPRHSMHQSRLMELQDQVDTFNAKIKLEQNAASELSKHTRLMKRKLLQVRKDMGGINAAKETQRLTQKQITILENRLDKSLVKFNNALAENKDLRGNIDNLRRERVVFDEIYQKMSRNLENKKKDMAEIIETSNQCYEDRDRFRSEAVLLVEEDEEDQRRHNEEILELDRLHDEIQEKRQNGLRITDDATIASMMGTNLSIKDGSDPNNAPTEESLSQKVANSKKNARRERKILADMKDKISMYEDALEEIKRNVGVTDIDEFVKIFIVNEEQHFSLFNYVNGQTQEIEKLENELAKLKVEERKHSSGEGGEEDHSLVLQRQLQDTLDAKEALSRSFEEKFTKASKTMSSLRIGIQNVFYKAGCDVDTMTEILRHENIQVSDTNIMQFLGMIEQRANELLQLSALSHVHEEGKELSDPETLQNVLKVIGPGPNFPIGDANHVNISIPGMNDYSDNEDSDNEEAEVPQNLDQIKKSVMLFMSERPAMLGAREKRSKETTDAVDARPSRGDRASRLRKAF
eukprot:g5226.t1